MSEVGEAPSELPFSVKSGEVLSKENIENITRTLGPEYVVKVPTEHSIESGLGSLEYLKEMKGDYELLQKYVPGFVPKTFFIRGQNEEGKPTNFLIQERVKGKLKPLHQVLDEELKEPQVREQLLAFVRGVRLMYKETGKIPDMFGRPIKMHDPRFYKPRYADNIVIAEQNGEKKVYLTDVGAITRHAVKRDLRHRVSMNLLRRNLAEFEKQLSL